MAEPQPLDAILYRKLPLGTILTFLTAKGGTVMVEIMGGVREVRYGGAREVKILAAPAPRDNTVGTTAYMFAVRPNTVGTQLGTLYQAAQDSIGEGDKVWVVWTREGQPGPMTFTVDEVSISIPV